MAVSRNWGSFKRGLGLISTGLGMIQGRFRAEPYANYMAVSVTWGLQLLGRRMNKDSTNHICVQVGALMIVGCATKGSALCGRSILSPTGG